MAIRAPDGANKVRHFLQKLWKTSSVAHKTWWLPLLMLVVEKDTELTAVVITPFVKLLRAPKTLNLVSFCANLSFFNELSRLPGYTQWPLTTIKQRTIMFHKWIKTLFLMTKNIIFVIASKSTIFIEAKGRVVCVSRLVRISPGSKSTRPYPICPI